MLVNHKSRQYLWVVPHNHGRCHPIPDLAFIPTIKVLPKVQVALLPPLVVHLNNGVDIIQPAGVKEQYGGASWISEEHVHLEATGRQAEH